MLRVRPFAALRPLPNLAARVASLPYDVVSRAEAAALAEDNPFSFLHVVRADIDVPPEVPADDPAVYVEAARNLARLTDQGVLVREGHPRLYLYRLVMGDHTQVGVVGCCHVEDYAANVIKRHETTRPDKERDRTEHMLAVGAHTGNVLLAFRDQPEMSALIRRDMNSRPLFHFNAPDGVTHTVWAVDDAEQYAALFALTPCAYIADGHHRVASAARAARTWREQNRGGGEGDWFLAALFPASRLRILAYNRLVTDPGIGVEELLRRLADVGRVTGADGPRPAEPGTFCVYAAGRWRRVDLDPATIDRTDPVRSLDVSLLQDRVLGPILGIDDPRNDPRLDFVGGVDAARTMERRAGGAGIAFSLHPTSMEQLLAVADAGLDMPPKSTWFEPKLRSGLFVHEVIPAIRHQPSAASEEAHRQSALESG